MIQYVNQESTRQNKDMAKGIYESTPASYLGHKYTPAIEDPSSTGVMIVKDEHYS